MMSKLPTLTRMLDDSPRRRSSRLTAMLAVLVLWLPMAQAQVSVTDSGTASYGYPVTVPPGIGGMSPNIGLSYSGTGSNGPVGYGWGIQGMSTIMRCPQTRGIDGFARGVSFTVNDKLCLDGQRLIQTDAAGNPVNAGNTSPSASNPFQVNDSLGGSGTSAVLEFRTEKDSFARIRAYGSAGGNPANGPAYFKVWTKSGQIYEYGASPSADANTNALVAAQGSSVAMVWAVARISDTLGNYIDFKYIQRDTAWGSGPSTGPQLGREWNLAEIQYTGNGSQPPANKIVFDYADRADNPGGPQDRAEAYLAGSKNVSIARLRAIRTYVNWPGPALGVTAQGTAYPAVPVSPTAVGNVLTPPAGVVKVKTIKLAYTQGPTTGRSLVSGITECGGANEDKCSPAPSFHYSPGGGQSYQANPSFAASPLSTANMMDATNGNYGVVLGDFNGDGKTDILRWGNTASDNRLWISNGDGTFAPVPAFNLTTTRLFSNDGCYSSVVADFNGDGVADILRTVQATNGGGGACSTGSDVNLLFIGNADGSFQTGKPLTGISLASAKEKYTSVMVECDGLARSTPYPLRDGDRLAFAEQAIDGAWLALTTTMCPRTTKTAGTSFLLLDVNGDGVLDIITTTNPGYTKQDPSDLPTSDQLCSSIVCTHVYLGSTAGTFTELTTTNLTHHSVYNGPPTTGKYAALVRPNTLDIDGDGLTDLSVNSGTWRSNGDGTFMLVAGNAGDPACANRLDFNGDGRLDCVNPAIVAGMSASLVVTTGAAPALVTTFNLTAAGQELYGWNDTTQRQSIGMLIGDFTRDGRSGILRWEDDPANNTLYLSNGDGTFRTVVPSGLTGTSQLLSHSNGMTTFLAGDFTGRGTLEILRMKDPPTAGSEATTNEIYEKVDKGPTDQLVSVTSPTGLTTTLSWVPLSNPYYAGASGTLGGFARYATDRGGSGAAATYPQMDITIPLYVVATSVSDTGVGNNQVATEYAYSGLKADVNRGMLGFRQNARQFPAPNGTSLTQTTQHLQASPYIGSASSTWTRIGSLPSAWTASGAISTASYTYCDKTAANGAESQASPAVPCTTSAKVQKPYLYSSVESGTDPAGYALPTVTTVNTFDPTGNPTNIAITSTGSALGLSQTFSKTTANVYQADNTAGDNWVVGRLQQATQRNVVPNSLGSIATVAGSAPNASATQGTAFATLGALSYGSVTVGAASTLTSTLTNIGGVALTMTAPSASSVSGAGFTFASTTCGSNLPANGSCTITLTFTPTTAAAYSGTLAVSTGAVALSAALTGTGITPSVVFQPALTNWGTIGVASDSGDWPTIKNNSSVAVLITAHTTVSGPAGMWSWQGQSGYCQPGSTVLQPGGSCQTFFGTGSLTTPGAYSATDQISYQAVGVTGTTFNVQQGYSFAMAQTTANSSGLNFGNVTVNTTSASQSFVLTNNAGNSPVNISVTMVGNQPGNFPMSNNCGSNLAAGASCTVTVSFNPTWAANGFSASVQVATTYPRIRGGTPEGYYYAAPVFNIPVSGNGVIPYTVPTISPNPKNLDSVAATLPPGSATGAVTLSNPSGNPSLVISGISVGASTDPSTTFTIAAGGTCTVNGTVAPGASCTINVTGSGRDQCARNSATLTVTYSGGWAPSTSTVTRYYLNRQAEC